MTDDDQQFIVRLGEVIRLARAALGVSREEFVQRTPDVARYTMEKVEAGRSGFAVAQLLPIARGLDVPLSLLIRAAELNRPEMVIR